MEKMLKRLVSSAVMLVGCITFQSCQTESPFTNEGSGTVRLNVSVNSSTTRADGSLDDIKQNARIYISDSKGVLNKWVGVQNIPVEGFSLRYGNYCAEVLAGDSVTASFDKRYFKGKSDFEVNSSSATIQVSVVCRLANVVASIDETTIDSKLVTDLKIEISNSKGSLVYTNDNIMDYGYFMMPVDDTSLSYVITGLNSRGNSFTKTGVIENVESGHNYRLKFSFIPDSEEHGGALFNIIIADEDLYNEEIEIYGKPAFAWRNNKPKGESQIVGHKGEFESYMLLAAAYEGFESLIISTTDSVVSNILKGNEFDIIKATDSVIQEFKKIGINIESIRDQEIENLHRYFVEFTSDFLNNLPERETEYVINMSATDAQGKKASFNVRVANTDEAVEDPDPIVIDAGALEKDLTAVGSRSAVIPVTIVDENVQSPKLLYRASGTSGWNEKNIETTRSDSKVMVRISGLKADTEYEYMITSEGFESDILKFHTETEFQIPNASFEDWTTYSASTLLGTKTVTLPGSTGDKVTSFWGSGNEGAATANMTLTDKSTDMAHSGTYSARLESKSALGVLAAGNIFSGTYVKTDGTNGVLSFGRSFDGSHPSKLCLWANYRPGSKVKIKNGNESLVPSNFAGGKDHGQIYVALTTGTVEIRTNPSDRKLFNPTNNDSDYKVIGYGEVTWTDNFGPDGSLESVEIPIQYTSLAKSVKPTHILIVVSASKYGDYFSGSEGSVMYLDDFELIYE